MSIARPQRISAVLSDVDGTLVTGDKQLTSASISAVAALRAAGITFAIVSSRPPAGLKMLVEALAIDTPVSAFNGGVIARPNGSFLAQHFVERDIGGRALVMLQERGVGVWVFTADQWLLRDPEGPYVAREQRTVRFDPTLVSDFGPYLDGVGKIVGVSGDFDHLAICERELRDALGKAATVDRSQRYYLDVTHPLANKGAALAALAEALAIPPDEFVAIGDGFNDIPMFRRAGFSIAMGNSAPEVKQAADRVTGSNEEDGFGRAIESLLAPAKIAPGTASEPVP